MNLSDLYQLIGKHYVFHSDAYPAIRNINTKEPFQAFVLNHVLLHAVKQTGKLATIAEAYDHAGNFRQGARELIRESAAKLIVNGIQLAAHFDIDPDELETAIRDSLK